MRMCAATGMPLPKGRLAAGEPHGHRAGVVVRPPTLVARDAGTVRPRLLRLQPLPALGEHGHEAALGARAADARHAGVNGHF